MDRNSVQNEWAGEVYAEFQKVHKAIADSKADVLKEITANREEFVIFKTKVNTRTAMISTIIGAIVLLTSLLLNIGAIKDRHDAKAVAPTEQTE
jgi:hypothetical protein